MCTAHIVFTRKVFEEQYVSKHEQVFEMWLNALKCWLISLLRANVQTGNFLFITTHLVVGAPASVGAATLGKCVFFPNIFWGCTHFCSPDCSTLIHWLSLSLGFDQILCQVVNIYRDPTLVIMFIFWITSIFGNYSDKNVTWTFWGSQPWASRFVLRRSLTGHLTRTPR